MAYTDISDFREDLQKNKQYKFLEETFIVEASVLFSAYLLEAPAPHSVTVKSTNAGSAEYIIKTDVTIPLIAGQFRVITGETDHCGYIEIMPYLKEKKVVVNYTGMGTLMHARTLKSIVYRREHVGSSYISRLYENAFGKDGYHLDWALAVHNKELLIIGPNPSMKFNKITGKFEELAKTGIKTGLDLGYFAHYSDGTRILTFGGSRYDESTPRGRWVEPNNGWASYDGTNWKSLPYIGSATYPYNYSAGSTFKAVNIPGEGLLIVGGGNRQHNLRVLFWDGKAYRAPATKEGITAEQEPGLAYYRFGDKWKALETRSNFGLVMHNGFVYLIGGASAVHKTKDGQEWEPVLIKNVQIPNHRFGCVSWDGYIWMVGVGDTNEIWRSKDGQEWSKLTKADGGEFIPRGAFVDCTVFEEKLYIVAQNRKWVMTLSKLEQDSGVEIGLRANAKGHNSIAIGTDAVAEGMNSAAFGAGATSPSNNTIVIGGTNAVVRTSNGNVVTSSDRRDKADIQPSSLGLDFIKGLKPCAYKDNREALYERYIDGDRYVDRDAHEAGVLKRNRTHHGFIAQDVLALQKEQLDDADAMKFAAVKRIGGGADNDEVTGDGRSTLAIDYLEFIAPLTKAIQELSTKVDSWDKQ